MKKHVVTVVLVILFFFALFGLQTLLMPKYMENPFEGALTAEYYRDTHRNEVLIIGDCEVYENISPVTLWQNYGYSSYIRGNAKQLMWQSYAMLEDALRYETPKVVVLSVLTMIYGEPQHDAESYNRMALDGMRPSLTKYNAVKASVLPKESIASYAMPILRFHSRWNELNQNDIRYFFKKRKVSIAGFVMRSDTLPAPEWIPGGKLLPDYDFGPKAWAYLDKITALCKEKGIQLVLFKAPSLSPYWYPQWDAQIIEYAQKERLLYLNALDKQEDIGLDFQAHTYDAGLHLNRQGAEKMALYLGGFLQKNCAELTDLRGDKVIAAQWNYKTAQYDALKAAQEADLARIGRIETFLVPSGTEMR